MLKTLTKYALGAVIVGSSLMATPAGATTTVAEAPSPDTKSDRSSSNIAVPAPRGPLSVASTSFHLVDSKRRDPWVPESGNRELMVSMHYPTLASIGRPAAYMTPSESEAIIDAQRDSGVPIPPEMPDTILSTVDTNAVRNAVPLPSLGGRPLIVLSPGFSMSRSSLTGLATDLASRGYVVASIDHAHESYGIEMPDGRLVTCAACDTDDYARVPRGRKQDVSFVLDRLLSRRSPWAHSWTIDRDRIGMAGHSIGGNSAASTMQSDPRIDAGINLDGTFFDRIKTTIDRPFMMLGTQELHTPSGDESWPRAWRKLRGPRYWFTVEGSNHGSFTDFPVLTEQAGIEPGPLPGRRSMSITRAYSAAFLDKHLRGLDRPLLDGTSPHWPEVNSHR